MPPSELGWFQMMRQACMRKPYSRTSASLFVWMAAVWPAPSLSIFSHISKACSLSSALSTACTGASFSWVSGSSSETSLHSAARIVASAGISKPAALAMNCGDLPGTTEMMACSVAQIMP